MDMMLRRLVAGTLVVGTLAMVACMDSAGGPVDGEGARPGHSVSRAAFTGPGGKADVMVRNRKTRAVSLAYSTGSAFTPGNPVTIMSDTLLIGDVNGDGLGDLIGLDQFSGGVTTGLSIGTGFSPLRMGIKNFFSGQARNSLVDDFTGDGKADVLVREWNSGSWRMAQSIPGATPPLFQPLFTAVTWWTDIPAGNFCSIWAADVNGDAKADLISWERYVLGDPPPPANKITVALSTGSGFAPAQTWLAADILPSGQALFMGDANGDGKADLIAKNGSHAWSVCLSTGSSFDFPSTWQSAFGNGIARLDFWVGDVTGDGKVDLVNHGVSSGTWLVSASDGTAFGAAQTWLHNFATGYDWEAISGGNVGEP